MSESISLPVIHLVQYGVAGVAVIMMILTFFVITREQKRPSIRGNFIRILWIFIGLAGASILLLFILEILRWNRPVDHGTFRECRTSLNGLSIALEAAETDRERALIADDVSRSCKVLWEQIDASM
ncbi:MAG: hypothetical protein R6X02_06070 [Enhygromyxa sp.]